MPSQILDRLKARAANKLFGDPMPGTEPAAGIGPQQQRARPTVPARSGSSGVAFGKLKQMAASQDVKRPPMQKLREEKPVDRRELARELLKKPRVRRRPPDPLPRFGTGSR
jgi:hypothetical protein